jgi:hypothetical protein
VIAALPVAEVGQLNEAILRLRQLPLNIPIALSEIAMTQMSSIRLRRCDTSPPKF